MVHELKGKVFARSRQLPLVEPLSRWPDYATISSFYLDYFRHPSFVPLFNNMSGVLLDYPPSLAEYAVTEQEFLRRHPEFDILCTGVVVFNKEGKLLLVQRAAEEKAFPNFWVCDKRRRI